MDGAEKKERKTILSSVQKIRATLDDAFVSLGLPPTTERLAADGPLAVDAEKLHPYGPANLQEVQRKLKEEFKFVRETLAQLRGWAAAESETAVTKFLSHNKDRMQLAERVQTLQKSLQQCAEMVQQRSEEAAADGSAKGAPGGPQEAARALIRRVEAVAKDSGYSVFHAEIEAPPGGHGEGEGHVAPGSSPHASPSRPRSTPRRDDPNQQPVLTLATTNILIDIMAGHSGMIQSAKLTYTNAADKLEIKDDDADRHLTELLRRGQLEELAVQLRGLTRLEALDTAYPPARVRQALKALHDDVAGVAVREEQSLIVSGTPDSAVPLEQARRGHGLVRGAADGTRLLYYLPAAAAAAARASSSHPAAELWAGGRALQIGAEEGPCPSSYPSPASMGPAGLAAAPPPASSSDASSSSSVSALLGHCPWGEAPPEAGEARAPCPVQFCLRLDPPVRMAAETARRAVALVYPPSASAPGAPASSPSSSSSAPGPARVVRVRTAGGALHHYCISQPGGAAAARTVAVSRLPMTHGGQLLPILALLRQELAFGELLASCTAGGLDEGGPGSSSLPPPPKRPRSASFTAEDQRRGPVTVEVTPERPRALHCALVHPQATGLFSVRFEVAPGGAVSVAIEVADGDLPPCGDAAATAVARDSMSVPETISVVLAGGPGPR
eukprot:tig00000581_g2223.t1